MASKKSAINSLPKDKEIIAEYKRLLVLFKGLPDKQFEIAKQLLSRAAFLAVTLQRLEVDVVKNGFVEIYTNGANQCGKKKSTAADLHISFTKNLIAVMKQLNDLLPDEISREWDELEEFINS